MLDLNSSSGGTVQGHIRPRFDLPGVNQCPSLVALELNRLLQNGKGPFRSSLRLLGLNETSPDDW